MKPTSDNRKPASVPGVVWSALLGGFSMNYHPAFLFNRVACWGAGIHADMLRLYEAAKNIFCFSERKAEMSGDFVGGDMLARRIQILQYRSVVLGQICACERAYRLNQLRILCYGFLIFLFESFNKFVRVHKSANPPNVPKLSHGHEPDSRKDGGVQ